jgi:hypothetical protein
MCCLCLVSDATSRTTALGSIRYELLDGRYDVASMHTRAHVKCLERLGIGTVSRTAGFGGRFHALALQKWKETSTKPFDDDGCWQGFTDEHPEYRGLRPPSIAELRVHLRGPHPVFHELILPPMLDQEVAIRVDYTPPLYRCTVQAVVVDDSLVTCGHARPNLFIMDQ